MKEEKNDTSTYRNLVFFGEAGVDRSPGGTGTSARMAQRFFRGQQAPGDKFVHESIIGSTFEGQFAETTIVGDCVEAIVPRIRGRAHIIAQSTFLLDPEDPVHGRIWRRLWKRCQTTRSVANHACRSPVFLRARGWLNFQ
ncbi:MAG TPA: proline racemase family protein [Rhizobium sp.]